MTIPVGNRFSMIETSFFHCETLMSLGGSISSAQNHYKRIRRSLSKGKCRNLCTKLYTGFPQPQAGLFYAIFEVSESSVHSLGFPGERQLYSQKNSFERCFTISSILTLVVLIHIS